ncbi:hypothetical protein BT63DRAFT_457803 [Microthyrium microscopicum]|uniref:Uncharacterized protein n=1 Tax=Microthyrium microscopicum TaxID=703497 RepID=A0A6A6U3K6_9PEZI|nr:hypothetical protein BT63DRAFT_457803 [Microthyrium microscopicum]
MKSLAILYLTGVVAAGIIDKRQFGADFEKSLWSLFGVTKNKTETPLFTTKTLTPQFDPKAKRELLIWGPFQLQPANGTHKAVPNVVKLDKLSDVITTRVKGMCRECMVLYAQADVSDKTGKKMDIDKGVYSHHVIMADVGRVMVPVPAFAKCPDGSIGGFNFDPAKMAGGGMGGAGGKAGHGDAGHGKSMLKKRQFAGSVDPKMIDMLKTPGGQAMMAKMMPAISIFVGQGDDGTAMRYAAPKGSVIKSGFHIGKNDEMNLMSEVVNYDNAVKDIYVSLDYEYIPMPGKVEDGWYDTGNAALNVQPCGGLDLMFPPKDKAIKYTSPPWDVIMPGYLLDIKPHLHDGGINVTLSVNGKVECVSSAVYGAGAEVKGEKWETITGYTPCNKAIEIKPGDKLAMDSTYDVTSHKLRPTSDNHGEAEGMAFAQFTFAVKR